MRKVRRHNSDGQGRGNSHTDSLERSGSTALRTSWPKHSSDMAKSRILKGKLQKAKPVRGHPVSEIHLPFALGFCCQRAALASSMPLPRLISFLTAYPENCDSFSSHRVFTSSTYVFATPNSTPVSTTLCTRPQHNWER